MVVYSQSTTLIATTATVAADTYSNGTSTPGTGWAFAPGTTFVPITAVAADWIVIQYSLTAASASTGLWVCSDGALVGGVTHGGTYPGTVITAGAASTLYLPPEVDFLTIGNLQPMPNWNAQSGVIQEYSGFDKAADQSESWGLTAQSGMTGSHNANHWPYGPNFLAFIPAVASSSGFVTITFQ
jgi:hypothetical protein